MTSIYSMNKLIINKMKTKQLVLVQRELDLLKRHLSASDLSNYNKSRLLSELNSAMVMKDDDLPDDAVCVDSEVEIQDIESSQKFTFQIVLPTEANMQKHRVSVFAPIAVALLGYRTGAKVQWEMPNGIKTFEVLNVRHKAA